jgi:glutaredoxin 3
MVEVKVYTTNYCGYCHAAKALLGSLGVPFTEVDVTNDQGTRAQLVVWTGQRTVPQIFIGGRAIGGYSDMQALHRAGELLPMLRGEGE